MNSGKMGLLIIIGAAFMAAVVGRILGISPSGYVLSEFGEDWLLIYTLFLVLIGVWIFVCRWRASRTHMDPLKGMELEDNDEE